MFKVYAVDPKTNDRVLIHDDIIPDINVKLIDPKLTLQESSAGSFSFLCPSCNPGYSTIKRLATLIIIYRNGTEIWRGRVIQESEDFYFNRSITCEGELGYLNDTLQPPHAYLKKTATPKDLLTSLLDIHNSKIGSIGRIEVGYVNETLAFKNDVEISEDPSATPSTEKYILYEGVYLRSMEYWAYGWIEGEGDDHISVIEWHKIDNMQQENRPNDDPLFNPPWVNGETILRGKNIYVINPDYEDADDPDTGKEESDYYYTNRESTLDCINNLLLSKLDGYIVTRRENDVCYLDYFAKDEYNSVANQVVKFGENLMNFTKNWDMTDFATVIVPLGAEIKHDADWPGDEGHPKYLTDYVTVEDYGSEYVQAEGTYVKGTAYYSRTTDYRKASTSGWTAGSTDVSDYYIKQTVKSLPFVEYHGPYNRSTDYYVRYSLGMEPGDWKHIDNDYQERIGRWTEGQIIGSEIPFEEDNLWYVEPEPNEGEYTPGDDVIYDVSDPHRQFRHVWVVNPIYPANVIVYKKVSEIEGESRLYDSSKTYYEKYYVYERLSTSDWEEGVTDVSTYYLKQTNNKPYVMSSTAKDTYGWIEKVVIWEDIKEPQELYAKAIKYLSEYQFDNMSLVVSVLDLSMIGVENAQAFKLLDKVLVKSEKHGLNKYFPITKITIPLDNPENTEYTFGKVTDNSFTGSYLSK